MSKVIVYVITYCATSLFGEGVNHYRLKVDTSKNVIYEGEPILVSFTLYSNNHADWIEVVKFPEFTGFWKENITLRQGEIVFSSLHGPQKKAVIGSYKLIAMVGDERPHIEPMKIAIKSLTNKNDQTEQILFSETPNLVIKKLPPVPRSIKNFIGAVGQFKVIQESRHISFKPNEPISLRFGINGVGNFEEMNALPISFPPFIEVVSMKTWSQPLGVETTKVFEYHLISHRLENFELSPPILTYFNPYTKTYSSLNWESVHFKTVKASRVESVAANQQPVHWPYPRQLKTLPYHDLLREKWFLWVQLILLSVFVGFYMSMKIGSAYKRYQSSSFAKKRRLFRLAQNAFQKGDVINLTRYSELIVMMLFKFKFKKRGINKRIIMSDSEQQISNSDRDRVSTLLGAYNETFSEKKETSNAPSTIFKALTHLVRVIK